jgi:hypothetical protein
VPYVEKDVESVCLSESEASISFSSPHIRLVSSPPFRKRRERIKHEGIHTEHDVDDCLAG